MARSKKTQGYRVDRLQRRRRGTVERLQTAVLYVLAAGVAFAAVLGGWYVATHVFGKQPAKERQGYLALIKFTPPNGGPAVGGALVVMDPLDGSYHLYTVPRDLLLDGPEGEYVYAGDAMDDGTYRQDFERLVGEKVNAVYEVPVTALLSLASGDHLALKSDKAITVNIGGALRTFRKGSFTVPTALAPQLYSAAGKRGDDSDAMQRALLQAVFTAAALRPAGERQKLEDAIVARSSGGDPKYLKDALRGLGRGTATVDRVPSHIRVAEGEFAFVPDPADIMSAITRKAPGYRSKYTVLVRNGTGKLGAAEAVVQRLSALDVNLPSPGNADSFGYHTTQILAGKNALPMAQDIRAILGRGVVLTGAQLPANTIVVNVGSDLKVTTLQPKDQQ